MKQNSPTPIRRNQSGSMSTEPPSSCESAPEPASAIPWTRMRHLKLLAFSTLFSSVLGTTIFYTLPYRRWLHGEDNVVENLSVLFFTLAFLVATIRWIKSRQSNHRLGWLPGVAAMGAVGALEELSYGQRVFEYSVPTIAGADFDALHDFANIAYGILKENFATNLALIALVSAGCVGLFAWCAVRYGRRIIAEVKGSEPLLILTFLVLLITTAVVIDLEIVKFKLHLLRAYEEIFEMNAAFGAFLLSLVVTNSAIE